MYSKIFMPGDRPDLFPQMLATGAHFICLDLEDTVTASRKTIARQAVADLLGTIAPGVRARIIVRVNGLDSGLAQADLAAVLGAGPALINIPKIESADEVGDICAIMSRIEGEQGAGGKARLLVNIESPRGLRRAYEIAAADARIAALQIGYADLLEPYSLFRKNPVIVGHIQSVVRLAAAEAGVHAYDGVFAGLDDDAFFREECHAARKLGFLGKSCFNRSQVSIANEVFAPTKAEIDSAQRIVDAAAKQFSNGAGLFELDGRIVDEPFVNGARQLLKRVAEFEMFQNAAG